jgi:hypothetical protein
VCSKSSSNRVRTKKGKRTDSTALKLSIQVVACLALIRFLPAPSLYFKGTLDNLMYWDRALVDTDFGSLCTNVFTDEEANLNLDNWTVFPNPSSESISLNGIGNDVLAQLSIFDSRGKLIRTTVQTKGSIDISDLAIGIYYLKVESKSSAKVLKFIKE